MVLAKGRRGTEINSVSSTSKKKRNHQLCFCAHRMLLPTPTSFKLFFKKNTHTHTKKGSYTYPKRGFICATEKTENPCSQEGRDVRNS